MILNYLYPKKVQVIVHTKSNKSIRGFVWRHNDNFIQLKKVELLQGSDSIIPLDGDLLIYRTDVEFIQLLD